MVIAAAVIATDVVGQLDQRRGRDQAFGAVCAQRVHEPRVAHTVADGNVGHAFTDFLDHTRGFDAHPRRKRQRVEAGTEVRIGEVETHGGVPQANLSRPGLADLHFLEVHDLGAAGLVDANCLCHHARPRLQAALRSGTPRSPGLRLGA